MHIFINTEKLAMHARTKKNVFVYFRVLADCYAISVKVYKLSSEDDAGFELHSSLHLSPIFVGLLDSLT